jgi:hypothetical protein
MRGRYANKRARREKGFGVGMSAGYTAPGAPPVRVYVAKDLTFTFAGVKYSAADFGFGYDFVDLQTKKMLGEFNAGDPRRHEARDLAARYLALLESLKAAGCIEDYLALLESLKAAGCIEDFFDPQLGPPPAVRGALLNRPR